MFQLKVVGEKLYKMKDIELEKVLEYVNTEYLKITSQKTVEYIWGRRLINFKKNFSFIYYYGKNVYLVIGN